MSVPNQKTIYIQRSSDTARKDFFKVSNESLSQAMMLLTPRAFVFWIYLADNANGYKKELYPIDFTERSGQSYDSYRKDFQELLECGYLTQSKVNKNSYLFNEKSSVEPDNIKSFDIKTSAQEMKELFPNTYLV